jgi:hypothetical protein
VYIQLCYKLYASCMQQLYANFHNQFWSTHKKTYSLCANKIISQDYTKLTSRCRPVLLSPTILCVARVQLLLLRSIGTVPTGQSMIGSSTCDSECGNKDLISNSTGKELGCICLEIQLTTLKSNIQLHKRTID